MNIVPYSKEPNEYLVAMDIMSLADQEQPETGITKAV